MESGHWITGAIKMSSLHHSATAPPPFSNLEVGGSVPPSEHCGMPGLRLSADSEALTRLLQLTASVEHLREVSRLELRLRSSLLWQDLGQLLGVWAGLVT